MLISRFKFYLYTLAMLSSGTLLTIIMKQISLFKSNGKSFDHPYLMAGLMFLSESICLLFHIISTSAQLNSISTKYLFAIPALFDLCGSVLIFIGLSLSTASIYQMMRGFIIVITCLYSSVFLKSKIFKHQIIGVFLTCLGLSIIGLSSIITSSKSAKNPALGIFFTIFSQFFSGGVFITEQVLLKRLKTKPLEAVGLEGFSGLCLSLLLLPILNVIPCHDLEICSYGYIENSAEALTQIFSDFFLFSLILLYMGLILIFNISGVSVTQITGAVSRTTIDTTRTVFIWILSILLGWETFSWVQLTGFIILLGGTLIYNEVIVVECFEIKESVEMRKNFIESCDWVEMNENKE